jgi:hypothetical protein
MKLLVTFRDTSQRVESFTVKYKILDNSLAKKWTDLLIKNFFLKDHPIEKVFCLQGWQTDLNSTTGRSLTYLCQRLNESIFIINKDLSAKGYDYINLNFTLSSMKNPVIARDLLNQIHHHFELLIGQVWNPSKWYGLAEEPTRTAIRNLNNLCHEIEGILRPIENPQSGYSVNVGLNGPDFSGNYFSEKIREDIEVNDYDYFNDYLEWGDCVLYYAQLGKRHIEAYNDRDDCIHDENISGYKFITGEFILCYRRINRQPRDFFDWLIKKGFDPSDKTLGLGYPVVAKLDNINDREQIELEIRKRDDLYSISLTDDTGEIIHTKVYPYTWKDQENLIK